MIKNNKHFCDKECGMNSYPNNKFHNIYIEFDYGNEKWYFNIQHKQTKKIVFCIINSCPFCEEKLGDII